MSFCWLLLMKEKFWFLIFEVLENWHLLISLSRFVLDSLLISSKIHIRIKPRHCQIIHNFGFEMNFYNLLSFCNCWSNIPGKEILKILNLVFPLFLNLDRIYSIIFEWKKRKVLFSNLNWFFCTDMAEKIIFELLSSWKIFNL